MTAHSRSPPPSPPPTLPGTGPGSPRLDCGRCNGAGPARGDVAYLKDGGYAGDFFGGGEGTRNFLPSRC